jgi:hypothetical protein
VEGNQEIDKSWRQSGEPFPNWPGRLRSQTTYHPLKTCLAEAVQFLVNTAAVKQKQC